MIQFKFLKQYYNTLKKDFNIKGELPSLKFLHKLLKRNFDSAALSSLDARKKHQEAWLLLTLKNKVIAALNYDLLYIGDNTYAAALVYLSVERRFRHEGLGTELINFFEKLITSSFLPALAKKDKTKKLKFLGTFIEVNDPQKMTKKELKRDYLLTGEKAKERIVFWEKRGFKKLNFNYIQPSLGDSDVKCLSLFFRKNRNNKITNKLLINYLTQFTEFCISNKTKAKNDPDLQKMIKELTLRF